jgi:hypothetical protein
MRRAQGAQGSKCGPGLPGPTHKTADEVAMYELANSHANMAIQPVNGDQDEE